MKVINDYAAILDLVAPALPANYSAQNLFADLLRKRVYAIEHEQLVAIIQFVDDVELHFVAVAGKGLSREALIQLAQFTACSIITAVPKSKAHARLYKRLGFTQIGEELSWQA